MAFDPDSRPRRKASAEAQSLPDGSTLLFDPLTSNAFPINESATLVWEDCDGEHTVAQIIDHLESIYDAPRETIAADVNRLLDRLAAEGLLAGETSRR